MNNCFKGFGIGSLLTGALLLFGCNENPLQSATGDQLTAAVTNYQAESATLISPAQRKRIIADIPEPGLLTDFIIKAAVRLPSM